MLRIVAATRHDVVGFRRHTLLGRSLSRLAYYKDVFPDVACSNSAGLPQVYNAALARAQDCDLIVFTHDDVWLDDWFLPDRVAEGLAKFAVVGVAGNRRRAPRQPAWCFADTTFQWDAPQNLSGAVNHVNGCLEQLFNYGESRCRVRLLDGLFLATRVQILRQAGVQFDPRFRFHFYDLDFCRSCERLGLALGTWPIAITHASGGNFGGPEWNAAYAEYLGKWQE